MCNVVANSPMISNETLCHFLCSLNQQPVSLNFFQAIYEYNFTSLPPNRQQATLKKSYKLHMRMNIFINEEM